MRAKVETFPRRLTYMFRSSILHVAQFLYLGDSNCEVTRLPAEPRPKSCASFLESTRRNLSPLRKNFTFEIRTEMHQTHFQVDSSEMCRFDETCIYVPEHVDDEVGCRVDGEHEVGDGHDLLDARVLVGAGGLANALRERRRKNP